METKCCGTCALHWEENWPKEVTVIRCGEEGKHRGRVTNLYHTGHPMLAQGWPAPAWCTQYTKEDC